MPRGNHAERDWRGIPTLSPLQPITTPSGEVCGGIPVSDLLLELQSLLSDSQESRGLPAVQQVTCYFHLCARQRVGAELRGEASETLHALSRIIKMVLNPHLWSFVCRYQSLLHFGTLPALEGNLCHPQQFGTRKDTEQHLSDCTGRFRI